jgi:hypothetical protein
MKNQATITYSELLAIDLPCQSDPWQLLQLRHEREKISNTFWPEFYVLHYLVWIL